jgi:hypothetical protein
MGFCRQPFQKDFHVRNERDRARFGASLVLRILTANVTGAATWRRFRGFGVYKVTEFQFGHAKDVRFQALTIELAVHLYPAVEFARIATDLELSGTTVNGRRERGWAGEAHGFQFLL